VSQTLYRKYRSQTFAELVGQEPVLRVLKNSILRGRLSHAYLFCGPRGTGKTSVARIFAKALNCLDPREGDACGVCANCLAIAGGTAVDVIEIDAASNRSVEDVEELRKRVGYAPLNFKYKVYIIDEVHMISGHGFNALLKTLEEPPGHVVFCLCTTEANKLPVTILSRCIRFDFSRLPLPLLAAHLQSIANQEGLRLDDDAALELAELAEGSARDAISLLDQLTVYCSSLISVADIRELFQLCDPAAMKRIIEQLQSGSPQELVDSWSQLSSAGLDGSRFLLDVAAGVKSELLAAPLGRWRLALEAIWKGLNLLKFDSFPALLVQLTLLEAQAAMQANPRQSAGAALTAMGTESAAPPPVTTPPAPVREAALDTAPEIREQTIRPVAAARRPRSVPAAEPEADSDWGRFMACLEEVSLTTYALLWQAATGVLRDDRLKISFRPEQKQIHGWLQEIRHVEALRAAAGLAFGRNPAILAAVIGEDSSELELTGSGSVGSAGQGRAVPTMTMPGTDISGDIEVSYDSDGSTGKSVAAPRHQSAPRSNPAKPRFDEIERLGQQLDAAAGVDEPAPSQGVSLEDAMSLFGANESQEEGNAQH
jgi:DNA polymerase-3 subunit gamma/tau